MTRLKIPLEEAEYTALRKLATNELRSPIDQARILLRLELERRGLVKFESNQLVQSSIGNPLDERNPQGEVKSQRMTDDAG